MIHYKKGTLEGWGIHLTSYGTFVAATLMATFMGGLEPFGRDILILVASGIMTAVYSWFTYLLVASDANHGTAFTLVVLLVSCLVAAVSAWQWFDGDLRKIAVGPILYTFVLSPLVLLTLPFSIYMAVRQSLAR